jgi:NAD(P)-dependent dehydrogenase (short-subunit alcohol dehydrogenase family)
MEGTRIPDKPDSRVWLITGAGSGLGRKLAEAALVRGEMVLATARSEEAVADLQEQYPGRALAARLDVTEPRQAEEAIEAGVAAFGAVDVIVNNAGYGLFGALEELPADELRREFDTNVFGAVNVLRAALPQMRRQRRGWIVQISSLEGVAPAVAGESAYAGSKFAVEGICEALAKEVGHLGIGVTIVEPGPLRTDFAGGARAYPPQAEDYAETVGAAFEWFEELAGNQPNDPALVASVIIDAVTAAQPPLRLVLGGEALAAVREKLDHQAHELVAWERVGMETAAG